MKIIIFIVAIFCFSTFAYSQEIKNADGRRLDELNKSILDQIIQIRKTDLLLDELKFKYSSEHPRVKEVALLIDRLNESLKKSQSERNSLLTKKLTDPLPNNDTALLKIIATQNERIIELLERIASKP